MVDGIARPEGRLFPPGRCAWTSAVPVRGNSGLPDSYARRPTFGPPFGPLPPQSPMPPRLAAQCRNSDGRCTLYRWCRARPFEFRSNYDPALTALSAALLELFQAQWGRESPCQGGVRCQKDSSNKPSSCAWIEMITRQRQWGLQGISPIVTSPKGKEPNDFARLRRKTSF
jgi:hypothetical protein